MFDVVDVICVVVVLFLAGCYGARQVSTASSVVLWFMWSSVMAVAFVTLLGYGL